MERTEWRLRLVKAAVWLAALLPLVAGVAFTIAGEAWAILVLAIPALVGSLLAALPLFLPARRFELWVPLSAALLFVAGGVLVWLGGLVLWVPAVVLLVAVPWRSSWRPVVIGVGVVASLIGLAWGGTEAWNCANPETRLVLRFVDPTTDRRTAELVDSDGVVAVGGPLGGFEVEVEFADDATEERDALAERLRRDPAVASVDARPERCD